VRVVTHSEDGERTILCADVSQSGRAPGGDVFLSVRPEDLVLHSARPRDSMLNVLEGRVTLISYLGNFVEYVVRAAGRDWRVQAHPHELLEMGAEVFLEIPPGRCLCLPGEATPPQ
jgi:ABC-type Fe3+/spermidine/putrescine transport system ATPase subunit